MTPLTALLVFLIAAVLDVAWTLCVRAVAERRQLRASVYSALTVGLGAFNLILIVQTPWQVVPAMLGAFAGTWWVMRDV